MINLNEFLENKNKFQLLYEITKNKPFNSVITKWIIDSEEWNKAFDLAQDNKLNLEGKENDSNEEQYLIKIIGLKEIENNNIKTLNTGYVKVDIDKYKEYIESYEFNNNPIWKNNLFSIVETKEEATYFNRQDTNYFLNLFKTFTSNKKYNIKKIKKENLTKLNICYVFDETTTIMKNLVNADQKEFNNSINLDFLIKLYIVRKYSDLKFDNFLNISNIDQQILNKYEEIDSSKFIKYYIKQKNNLTNNLIFDIIENIRDYTQDWKEINNILKTIHLIETNNFYIKLNYFTDKNLFLVKLILRGLLNENKDILEYIDLIYYWNSYSYQIISNLPIWTISSNILLKYLIIKTDFTEKILKNIIAWIKKEIDTETCVKYIEKVENINLDNNTQIREWKNIEYYYSYIFKNNTTREKDFNQNLKLMLNDKIIENIKCLNENNLSSKNNKLTYKFINNNFYPINLSNVEKLAIFNSVDLKKLKIKKENLLYWNKNNTEMLRNKLKGLREDEIIMDKDYSLFLSDIIITINKGSEEDIIESIIFNSIKKTSNSNSNNNINIQDINKDKVDFNEKNNKDNEYIWTSVSSLGDKVKFLYKASPNRKVYFRQSVHAPNGGKDIFYIVPISNNVYGKITRLDAQLLDSNLPSEEEIKKDSKLSLQAKGKKLEIK